MSHVASLFRGTGRALLDTYRLGGHALIRAPWLVALAIIPEFVQHVVEIRLGMFQGLEQARALANDAARWQFGYVKLAGFALAILLVARYWALGGQRSALLVRPLTAGRLALAIALLMAAGFGSERLGLLVPAAINVALQIVSWMLQMGILVWLTGILVEDDAVTLRTAFTRRLPTAALLLLLLIAAFAPAQALHGLNHRVALGQPEPLVWLLMVWDSLVVGLLAALVGSALWVAVASGASWRGWGRGPESA
jgi:hypothetical protein